MPALEQVKGKILLTKTISKLSLKTLPILAKKLILDAWQGPERVSGD